MELNHCNAKAGLKKDTEGYIINGDGVLDLVEQIKKIKMMKGVQII